MFIKNKNSDIKKKKRQSIILKTFMEVLYKVIGFSEVLEGVIFTKLELLDKGGSVIIFVYSQDSEEKGIKAIEKIVSYSKQIQYQMGILLKFRRAPKLEFIYDAHYQKILNINKLLSELQSEKK